MLFNSISFLLFFPLVCLVYFILPARIKWIWLLVTSYYFYMAWNPKYAILIATSTVITYISGLLIDYSSRVEDPVKRNFQRKLWVFLSFASNLSILFFFKYFNFALININRVLGAVGIQALDPAFDVLLPVGISFYTFQALSYTMDTYRGDIYAEKNLARYALFVSFFPQLVAGPIERSKNLLVQLNKVHKFNYDRAKNGLLMMLWGFFMKLVIADRAAILVDQVYNNYTEYGSLALIIATLIFTIQIYCDFGGYSNIAIGAAQLMGFQLMENFRQPYFAASIQDFWRRWHISLSSWFRDYLYIPLGGSRCSRIKRYRNVMVTFLLSGLWHGASWNFIVWGGLHGFYQVMGDLLKPVRQSILRLMRVNTDTFSHQLLQRMTTFSLVAFGWIFFRASGARAALGIIKRSASISTLFHNINLMGLDIKNFIVLLISIYVLFFVDSLRRRISIREKLAEQNLWFRWTCYLAGIMTVLIFGIYGPEYDTSQFIYFQF